jgi:hypothetical protein
MGVLVPAMVDQLTLIDRSSVVNTKWVLVLILSIDRDFFNWIPQLMRKSFTYWWLKKKYLNWIHNEVQFELYLWVLDRSFSLELWWFSWEFQPYPTQKSTKSNPDVWIWTMNEVMKLAISDTSISPLLIKFINLRCSNNYWAQVNIKLWTYFIEYNMQIISTLDNLQG